MTPIIDRMEYALRRYMRRRPSAPVAVLINPVDDRKLDLEYADLAPRRSPYKSTLDLDFAKVDYDARYARSALRDKRFKGLPVLCDLHVPEGCVALRFKPFT